MPSLKSPFNCRSLWLLLGFTLLAPLAGSGQKQTKIKLIRADDLKYDRSTGQNVQRLIGDVVLLHDSTYLYCDSAYLYEATNSFDGYGNVHIKVSDTLDIYSHLLYYDGNTKTAELIDSVRLVDKRATLTTDHLWYDRKTRIAWYLTGGRIRDEDNDLTSRKGYYYTNSKEAYFKDSVVLINPQYRMDSDTLKYNTVSEIAWFFGPTTITSDENLIYCEWGWYDTQTDKSQFSQNAWMTTEEQKLSGDTLYYDRNLDLGIATNNVRMTDTVHDILINGGYGEFRKRAGYAFVVDSAMGVLIDKHDSLFLHSDTLLIQFDTVEEKAERMLGFYKTKFFRKDLQGACDSLVYDFSDSTIFLYQNPILWAEENQLTADTINIALKNNEVDTLGLISSAFIISLDDSVSDTYNQIRGKTITGYFRENQIVKVRVLGNSETIYFIREEDHSLIGINKTVASDMLIYLTDNEITTITYIRSPKGAVYPEERLTREELFLKKFQWMDYKRPLKKEDIFIWEEEQ